MSYLDRFCLTVLFITLLISGGCSKEAKKEKEIIRAVKTMVVNHASKANERQLSGVVKSELESELSFRVSGKVESVQVAQGAKVAKGQVLATLDSSDYIIRLKSAQAELESAKAEMVNTREDFKRLSKLAEKKYSSDSDVDRAEAAYQAALSKVDIAKSKVENARNDLQRTNLTAPFEGKIGKRSVEPHEEVRAGQVLFELQSKGRYEVEVLVPETLIDQIAFGDKVTAEFPSIKNLTIPGEISEIGSKAESGNAFPIKIKLDQIHPSLRAGLTSEVNFYYGKNNDSAIYLIPTSSVDLRLYDSKRGKLTGQVPVYLFNPNTKQVYIKRVHVRDVRGNLLEVEEGLNEGDILVIAGVSFLSEGQKVKLWEPQYSLPATLDL